VAPSLSNADGTHRCAAWRLDQPGMGISSAHEKVYPQSCRAGGLAHEAETTRVEVRWHAGRPVHGALIPAEGKGANHLRSRRTSTGRFPT
jgi:hypothetical protein